METLETIALIVGMLASLAAVFLAGLAFRTYRELTPLAQLQRRRDEHMEDLASHVMQTLDRISTMRHAHYGGEPVAKFHFPGICHDAKLLDKMLDKCSRLGLVEVCLGDPNRLREETDRWKMSTSFRTGLVELATTPSDVFHELDPELLTYLDSPGKENTTQALIRVQFDFIKMHFFLGMIRLGDACIAYRKESSRLGGRIAIGDDLNSVIRELTNLDAPAWKPEKEIEWNGEKFREHCSNYIPTS